LFVSLHPTIRSSLCSHPRLHLSPNPRKSRRWIGMQFLCPARGRNGCEIPPVSNLGKRRGTACVGDTLFVAGWTICATKPSSPASTNSQGLNDSLSSRATGEGGNHGCERDFGKEVCCEAERRGTRTA